METTVASTNDQCFPHSNDGASILAPNISTSAPDTVHQSFYSTVSASTINDEAILVKDITAMSNQDDASYVEAIKALHK